MAYKRQLSRSFEPRELATSAWNLILMPVERRGRRHVLYAYDLGRYPGT